MDHHPGAHHPSTPLRATTSTSTSTSVTARPRQRSISTQVALTAGAGAAWLARRRGFRGAVIRGRVALLVKPGCLHELSTGRVVILVSGTNGKTTTTAMLAAALRTRGAVATNDTGANMLDGLTTTLAASTAPVVVAEIDELYLPEAIAQTDPALVVLLNLSRDQLDRAGEIARTVRALRAAAHSEHPPHLVANCDDPHVVHVAQAYPEVVWVAADAIPDHRASACPACATPLHTNNNTDGGSDGGWHCPGCDLRRPAPQWSFEPGASGNALPGRPRSLRAPTGAPVQISVGVPGGYNENNAATAIAAACQVAVEPAQAAAAIATVTEVAGRYQRRALRRHQVQLFLVKNPAGWAAVLHALQSRRGGILIAINAAEADGRDTSWLYDIEFGRLADREIAICGRRATDLAACLTCLGVAHRVVTDPRDALETLPSGPVYMLGDYTSFRELHTALHRLTTEHGGSS